VRLASSVVLFVFTVSKKFEEKPSRRTRHRFHHFDEDRVFRKRPPCLYFLRQPHKPRSKNNSQKPTMASLHKALQLREFVIEFHMRLWSTDNLVADMSPLNITNTSVLDTDLLDSMWLQTGVDLSTAVQHSIRDYARETFLLEAIKLLIHPKSEALMDETNRLLDDEMKVCNMPPPPAHGLHIYAKVGKLRCIGTQSFSLFFWLD